MKKIKFFKLQNLLTKMNRGIVVSEVNMDREEIFQIDSKVIDRKMVLIVIAQQKLISRQKFLLITGDGKVFLFI